MVSLLALVLLGAEPSTAVVLARRVSVPALDVATLVTQTSARLDAAGAPTLAAAETTRRLAKLALKDATTCGGKPLCLAELGRQLGVRWLVLVSASRVARERSLALELFDVSAGAVVDQDSTLVPTGTAMTEDVFGAFVARVAQRLAPEAPPVEKPAPPPKDTPLATQLVPPPPPVVLVLPPPPVSPSHTTSWVLGGVGVAVLGAGVGLLVAGLSTQNQVNGAPGPDGRLRSELTGSEAKSAAQTATTELGLAGAAAAIGTGLGAAAVVAW